MLFTPAEKRAALALCFLALLAAGLRLWEAGRRKEARLPFEPAPEDTLALKQVASRLEASRLPVDLNRAAAWELERLEGIGPELARRIVEARSLGGPYRDAADLAGRVRGLGRLTVERLGNSIRFGGSRDSLER